MRINGLGFWSTNLVSTKGSVFRDMNGIEWKFYPKDDKSCIKRADEEYCGAELIGKYYRNEELGFTVIQVAHQRQSPLVKALYKTPITSLLIAIQAILILYYWSHKIDAKDIALIYTAPEAWRAISAALSHVDAWHIIMNMTSWHSLGSVLEPTTNVWDGTVQFVVGTALVWYGIHKILVDRLGRPPPGPTLGFSGVLFAWSMVVARQDRDVCMAGVCLPGIWGPMAQIVAIQVLVPRASASGHAAGILVGLVGPVPWLSGATSLSMGFMAFLLSTQVLQWKQTPSLPTGVFAACSVTALVAGTPFDTILNLVMLTLISHHVMWRNQLVVLLICSTMQAASSGSLLFAFGYMSLLVPFAAHVSLSTDMDQSPKCLGAVQLFDSVVLLSRKAIDNGSLGVEQSEQPINDSSSQVWESVTGPGHRLGGGEANGLSKLV